MASPSERYAAARARAGHPRLAAFEASLPFPLDEFQRRACQIVEDGTGVLVAAPTGAGKTVVGEFAVALALTTGRKAFYTTPIKALSNQKYHDLVARHGAEQVGLLTGDSSVNGEAPVVVMTTEVLRNMMYAASSTLTGLGFVVMDEVHYMADRFRGAVWEEVIINLPESVQVVSLSATVSNAEEFGDWLTQVRGENGIVVTDHRPVPLWQHMLVGTTLFDLFADPGHHAILGGPRSPQAPEPRALEPQAPEQAEPRVNPDLLHEIRRIERLGAHGEQPRNRLEPGGRAERGQGAAPRSRGRQQDKGRRGMPGRSGSGSGGSGRPGPGRPGARRGGGASRVEVVRELDRAALLPGITFIFSRAGCEGAVAQLLSAGLRLVPVAEGERIRRLVEERISGLAEEDLGVLGYHDFVDGLSRGFAAHHAGMLPTFREIVEELFAAGRVKVVFATETLALGINMPARSVVLEKLVKFNGEAHVDVTAAEYTQLTGRAGRRGIDVEGHAVVQWTPGLDPVAVAGLAARRTYPLNSSFQPTYNMAVNLVATVGRERARTILESSFAQFQADRSVVGLVAQVRRNDEALAGYATAMTCHLGDFAEYAALRRSLSDAEKEGARARSASQRTAAALSLDALRIGDVFRIPTGRHAGWAVVVTPARTHHGEWTGPGVVTADRHHRRLTLADVPAPVEKVAGVKVPPHFNPRSPKARRDLATSLRIAVPHDYPYRPRPGKGAAPSVQVATGDDGGRVAGVRRQLAAHPCHQCPDREAHARWAERWWRLKRETIGITRRLESRTNTVARTFDRICDALVACDYLSADGTSVTGDGERLRRLYTERDLLTAQCLREGVFHRLDAAGLAALASVLVHTPRAESQAAPRMPNDEVSEAVHAVFRLWDDVEELSRVHALPAASPPDAGIAWAVHHWAKGHRLESVLRGQDLAAGDFVRRCKMIVDLLGQIADAATDPVVRSKARAAMDLVLRGVVSADRLD